MNTLKNIVITFILVYSLTACGFASDNPCNNVDITLDGPTKYKKLIVGPCNFRINLQTHIEDKYGHWKENIHHMSVRFGSNERAEYSLWDSLGVSVPCGACELGITGKVSVMDSKAHLMPWGCGPERPPLNILNVNASYVDRDGAVDIADANSAPWEDTPFPVYKHEFVPETMYDDDVCDGEPVLLDLTEACEPLVQAGVLEVRE